MWKNLIIGMAVAISLASPALAQSYDPSAGSGNLVGPPNAAYSGPVGPGARSDAAAGPAANIAAANGAGAYANGAYAYEPLSAQSRSAWHGARRY